MKNQKNKFEIYAKHLSFFLILLALMIDVSFAQKSKQDIRPLLIGKTAERIFKSGESHTYKIKLRKGQILRMDAIEKSINIQISILRVNSKQNLKSANFGFGHEREILTFIAEQTDSFDIKIESAKSLMLKKNLPKSPMKKDKTQVF